MHPPSSLSTSIVLLFALSALRLTAEETLRVPVDEWRLTPLTRPGWLADRLDLHLKTSLAAGYDDNIDLRDDGRSDTFGRAGLGLYSRWRGIGGVTSSIDADWQRLRYRRYGDADRETLDADFDLTRETRLWTYGMGGGYALIDRFDGEEGREREARQINAALQGRRRLAQGHLMASLACLVIDDRERDEQDHVELELAMRSRHERSVFSSWGLAAKVRERRYRSEGLADGRVVDVRGSYERHLQANLDWNNELGVAWVHADSRVGVDDRQDVVLPVGRSWLTADFESGQSFEGGVAMDLQRGIESNAMALASTWLLWNKPWAQRWSTATEARYYLRDHLGNAAPTAGWESSWSVSAALLWRLRRGIAGSLRLSHLSNDADEASFTRSLVEARLHVVF